MTPDQLKKLRLAAKLAGLPPPGFEGGEGGPMSKGGLVWSGEGRCIDWNPYTDGTDALDLLVMVVLVGGGHDLQRVIVDSVAYCKGEAASVAREYIVEEAARLAPSVRRSLSAR